jgi:dTDP-4-amino-4,6-dideoxygalactose transaminase
MDAFQALARKHGLKLLEDSAHAHGAKWNGVPVGGWGDIATFSFQSFKLITAGEGGIIVSRSQELIEKCWSYCNQGRKREGGWFDHYTLGTNYRMTGFQSAVLCEQLKKMPQQTDLRAKNVARFRAGLGEIPGITFAADDSRIERHPYYLLTLRYDAKAFSGLDRDSAIRALQAEGIPAKATYPSPLYRNPLFASQTGTLARCNGWRPGQEYQRLNLPEAERVCREGIWLNHTVFLGDERDVDDVLEGFSKVQKLASTVPVLQTADKA